MKGKLIPLRLNELLDDAPMFRRERTAFAGGLASSFNIESTRGVQPFNFHRHSTARAATRNASRFKLSPAAQHLTPELTGRARNADIFKLTMTCKLTRAPVE
jgi:hypothetical protein